MSSDSRAFFAKQYQARHYFPQKVKEWDTMDLKFQTHSYVANSVDSRLNCWKLRYSKMNV
jgi:hypothetical protein